MISRNLNSSNIEYLQLMHPCGSAPAAAVAAAASNAGMVLDWFRASHQLLSAVAVVSDLGWLPAYQSMRHYRSRSTLGKSTYKVFPYGHILCVNAIEGGLRAASGILDMDLGDDFANIVAASR